MTKDRLSELMAEAQARRDALRKNKGQEYTRGDVDVLANFKRVGAKLAPLLKNESPLAGAMVAWMVYVDKHWDAVASYIAHGKEFSTEPIEGRLDDIQVYVDLFRGLVEEHKTPSPKTGKLLDIRVPVVGKPIKGAVCGVLEISTGKSRAVYTWPKKAKRPR